MDRAVGIGRLVDVRLFTRARADAGGGVAGRVRVDVEQQFSHVVLADASDVLLGATGVVVDGAHGTTKFMGICVGCGRGVGSRVFMR